MSKLKGLKTVGSVMDFYEKEQWIFAWRCGGGEIEDVVRLTKSQFGKKLWSDMSQEDIKHMILSLLNPRKLLEVNPHDKEANKEANPELLRCIYFIITFFKQSSM